METHVIGEPCWLRDGCPGRTASCSSCQPTDDGCPVYRWFRDLFAKNAVIVENMKMPDHCGTCRMAAEGCGLYYCAAATNEDGRLRVIADSGREFDGIDKKPGWCPLKEV